MDSNLNYVRALKLYTNTNLYINLNNTKLNYQTKKNIVNKFSLTHWIFCQTCHTQLKPKQFKFLKTKIYTQTNLWNVKRTSRTICTGTSSSDSWRCIQVWICATFSGWTSCQCHCQWSADRRKSIRRQGINN